MKRNTMYHKLLKRIYWLVNDLMWHLPKFLRTIIIGNPRHMLGVTVSMSTYIERFESCLIPTLTKIHELFPSEQIIVVANGHYDRTRQEKYLVRLRAFCALFPNVDLFDFVEPVCISRMSNTSILNSKYEKKFGLNEDVRIALSFRRFLLKSGILNERIATINHSWCHVVNSKPVLRQVGYFDERLPEMGGEDDDYAARCAIAGIKIANYNTIRIGSSSNTTRKRDIINSWGKDMRTQKSGYSDLNHDFLLNQKWETSDSPFPGAVFVPNRAPKYWKLRPGMETPDFYPGKMR